MLPLDFSAKLPDMEHLELNNIEIGAQATVISFKLQRRAHTYPQYGCITDKVHDYRLQVIKDVPDIGKQLIWRYTKRRYRCHCCVKQFYKSNYLIPKRYRLTNRLTAYCIDQLRHHILTIVNTNLAPISSHRSLQLCSLVYRFAPTFDIEPVF